VRFDGNSDELIELAKVNAMALGAGEAVPTALSLFSLFVDPVSQCMAPYGVDQWPYLVIGDR
jgi:hypothetical protein